MSSEMYVRLPADCEAAYDELRNIPFYKINDVYRYAAYLLTNTEISTSVARLLEASECYEIGVSNETVMEDVKKLFTETIHHLSAIEISNDDLTVWITSQKEQGGVKEYHEAVESLYESLMLLIFEMQAIAPYSDAGIKNNGKEGSITCQYWGKTIFCNDEFSKWKSSNLNKTISNKVVLNHNNPFADISIEEQQFIYGSSLGQYEVLGLTTSHTLTSVAKDTEKSYMVLQPGFKIKKTMDLSKKKKQDVLFDDALTTEVAQKDDNVYVYID